MNVIPTESNPSSDVSSMSPPDQDSTTRLYIGGTLNNVVMMSAAKGHIATSLSFLRETKDYVIFSGYMPPATLTDSIESLESILTSLENTVVDSLLPPDAQADQSPHSSD